MRHVPRYIINVCSLGMSAWNAAFTLTIRAIAIPMICGNTVVLKASEICPRTQAIVAEVFQEVSMLFYHYFYFSLLIL
jgi:acyl-CoA reductase-like NAD-dependent aldehyde dehydrogenase